MGRITLYIAAGCMLIICARAHTADFNSDGKQDIVWRAPAGNPLIWQMNGLSIGSQYALSKSLDAGSAIVGAGKFFGPAGPDGILWVDSSDHLSVWQIHNGTIAQTCTVASNIDPSLSFLGIGDVNGDGIDDVLWRNASNGVVSAFLMNGCAPPVTVVLGTADASLSFAGTGDVDGHGYADLFWRDSSGNVVLWQIVNDVTSVTVTTLPTGIYTSWQIGAIADFDGDGKTDILWRDPSSTNLAVWLMSGTQYTATAVTTTLAGQPLEEIFGDGFEPSPPPVPFSLDAAFTILGAADFNGDGRADVLLTDSKGDVAILQMQGASVQADTLIPPTGDMPLVGLTGWRLPLDRPAITKVNNQVAVDWKPIAGSPAYTAYASATNYPASTGIEIPATGTSLSFGRDDTGYADKRYFSVSAQYHGIQTPPSAEAYIVEFSQTTLSPIWGAMAIADINQDGCMDLLEALGDCHGNFQLLTEAELGLTALSAPGRQYRDLRFADLDGDGILDLIANTYSSIDDPNSQVLFFRGIGNNQFVEDTDFTNLNIRGYGETIVIADFNNDGYLDVFLPQYSYNSPDEHSWLLINDGHGHFTDVSDSAGVAMRNVAAGYRSEGAQALDINNDGWIDLYAGSSLFLNNGDLTFTNVGSVVDIAGDITESPWGLSAQFDEGAKFFDLDNSGQLSLAINTVWSPPGIRIFKFDGVHQFTEIQGAIPTALYMNSSLGLTATDIDGDGLSDLVVAGGFSEEIDSNPAYRKLVEEKLAPSYSTLVAQILAGEAEDEGIDDFVSQLGTTLPNALPQLLVNRGGSFVLHDFYDDGMPPDQHAANDLPTFADFDSSGTEDIVSRHVSSLLVLMNQAVSNDKLIVSVLGNNGEQNQAGRIVHVTPSARSSVIMTQIVDGGSGYMTNAPYDLTFATPYPGSYTISVRFAGATYTTTAHSGDHVTMYANGTETHQ